MAPSGAGGYLRGMKIRMSFVQGAVTLHTFDFQADDPGQFGTFAQAGCDEFRRFWPAVSLFDVIISFNKAPDA